LVAGVAVCAVPLGYLPSVEIIQQASPLGVFAAGGALIFAGFLQLARDHRASEVLGSIVLLLLAGLAGWVTFFAPEGTLARVLPFIPSEVGDALSRLLFGLGAAACIGMTLWAVRRLIR
jgi:hypothetical protein